EQRVILERATTGDDELHDGLPSGVKKRKGFCQGVCLRAVCCSATQGWLGFPWPPKRGWAKRCATLPWPLSGWALQFLVFRLTRRSQCGGSGGQGGGPTAPGGAPRGAWRGGGTRNSLRRPFKRGNPPRERRGRGAAPPARPPPH